VPQFCAHPFLKGLINVIGLRMNVPFRDHIELCPAIRAKVNASQFSPSLVSAVFDQRESRSSPESGGPFPSFASLGCALLQTSPSPPMCQRMRSEGVPFPEKGESRFQILCMIHSHCVIVPNGAKERAINVSTPQDSFIHLIAETPDTYSPTNGEWGCYFRLARDPTRSRYGGPETSANAARHISGPGSL
jgi:hypothetical protein